MKYLLLNILSIFILCSCSTEDPDSRTKGKSIFGYKHGEWKGYYFDKTLKQTVNFSWGEMSGDYISYHQVNMLKDRLNFKVTKINKMEKGEIISSETKIRNPHNQFYMKMDSITHLPIHEIGYFKNGKPEGKFITYDTNGHYEEKTYKNGIVIGDILEYNYNDKLYKKTKTVNGEKNGLSLTYRNDGSVIYSTNYLNNMQDGEQKRIHPNGKVDFIKKFKKGRLINETYFDENGNVITK